MTRGHNDHLGDKELMALYADLRRNVLTLRELMQKYHLSERNVYTHRRNAGVTVPMRSGPFAPILTDPTLAFEFASKKKKGAMHCKPKADVQPAVKLPAKPNAIPSLSPQMLMAGKSYGRRF